MTTLSKLVTDPELRRFVTFLAVGVLNTAFGYAVFAVLVAVGLGAQLALVLSFAMGVIWNYLTHAKLVFATEGLGRLPAYVAVYVALYLLNAGALAGLMAMGLPPLIAQALFLPVAAVLAYIGIGRVLTGRFPWDRVSG